MAVTLGSRNVGDIIKIRENGVPVDFLIVHKGLPPSYYDGSCNGIWVLRKNVHSRFAGSSQIPNYPFSGIAAWLENTYYNMFDAVARAGIRYVKIPYQYASGSSTAAATGAAGAAVHCFLLSAAETAASKKDDFSSVLQYFQGCTTNGEVKRIAYDAGGTAQRWYLRNTSGGTSKGYIRVVDESGQSYILEGEAQENRHIRPAMILDPDMLIDDSGTVTVNTAPSTPDSIFVPGSIRGGSTITVSWSGSSDAQGNLEGYRLERSVNGGAWTLIYQGGGTSTANNVAYGTGSVAYRVKAYDSMGAESGYRTSSNVTVVNNTAPGAPQGITVPADIRGGGTVTVSWGPAADAENNLAGYELERSVNAGAWAQIFRGARQSHEDSITFGWQNVAYRVRAYDAYDAYSGYTTSGAVAVDNNRPPEISCEFPSGSDLGVKGEGFSVSYTVTDPDNNTGDVTVTETLDGTKKREFVPELGAVNTFGTEGLEFQCLANGQHTISISADDGKLAGTHTLTFTKSVTSAVITLETPLEADDQITVCAVAVNGYIPSDAQFRVLVTNNGRDTEPKWENCTQMVRDGANYVFSNQTAENGYAFNFKITVSRGESGEGGHITSVQGGFQ